MNHNSLLREDKKKREREKREGRTNLLIWSLLSRMNHAQMKRDCKAKGKTIPMRRGRDKERERVRNRERNDRRGIERENRQREAEGKNVTEDRRKARRQRVREQRGRDREKGGGD